MGVLCAWKKDYLVYISLGGLTIFHWLFDVHFLKRLFDVALVSNSILGAKRFLSKLFWWLVKHAFW
jgi:hypothetical protein